MSFAKIIIKKATKEEWDRTEAPTPAGPWLGYVLDNGEMALEIDSYRNQTHIKFGDGVSTWAELPYYSDTQAITLKCDESIFNSSTVEMTSGSDTYYGIVVGTSNEDGNWMVRTCAQEDADAIRNDHLVTTTDISDVVGSIVTVPADSITIPEDYPVNYVQVGSWLEPTTVKTTGLQKLDGTAVDKSEAANAAIVMIMDHTTGNEIIGIGYVRAYNPNNGTTGAYSIQPNKFLTVNDVKLPDLDVIDGNRW